MRILRPDAATASASSYGSEVLSLVGAIGRDSYINHLLIAGRMVAPVDFVSMFVYPSRDQAIFIGTDTGLAAHLARFAADHYQTRHYRDDPNIAVMFENDDSLEDTVTYQTRDDVPTASYRNLCYDRAQIADRLSLLGRTHRGQCFSVSFYSGQPRGALTDKSREALRAFTPFVRATAQRHLEWRVDKMVDVDGARARLLEIFPALSRREADVAAGVVSGLTADEIAARLGIGSTSVITHRKRAYERAGVTNQRELLQAFYFN